MIATSTSFSSSDTCESEGSIHADFENAESSMMHVEHSSSDGGSPRPESGSPCCRESGGVRVAWGASGTLVWIGFPCLH